jgi:outer membrane receptor protein involved in Fe transport
MKILPGTVFFRYLYLASLILFPLISNGQDNSFSVKGKVIDADSKEPVIFMQVALFKEGADTPLTYSDTKENGEFELKAPKGNYQLNFYLIGYDKKTIAPLQISGSTDLGMIEVVSENQNLEEVIVQAAKFPFRSDVEGMTINPEANMSNLGGTLLDILRNTPSVSVGDDGTIALRGSTGTNILINGRNSSLTQNLDQLPASAVDQIKIINNPNARFDADAEGGVIDIILKKGEDLGTNGSAELTYGTRGRMNTGLRFNHRTIKYNLYGGYNYRDWRDVGKRTSDRTLFEEDERLLQETDSESQNIGHTFNYGGDYYFGKNIISYEGVFTTNVDSQVNTLYSQLSRNSTGEPILDFVRRNNETEDDDGIDNAIIYERTFDNPDQSFRFLASSSFRNQYKVQNIDIFTNSTEAIEENLTGQERGFTDETRNIYVFQADYIHPLSEKKKIETGLKSILREFDNDFIFQRFQEGNQDFVTDPNVSNRFIYKDQVYAGYFIYAASSDKIDYSFGLRGEYTNLNTELMNTNEVNKQNYLNLFPSAQVLYKLDEENSLKFTYSRRIDRPRPWRLNPFPDITDSLSIRRGNPNLQPEKIHSLEFGHMLNREKSSFTTNAFFRHVDGQEDMITIIVDGISYMQPENLNSAVSYGLEFIGLGEVAPWWNISGGLTMFRIIVDGSNVENGAINKGFAWNTKLTSDFKLPWGINFQIVANYDSPEIEAQGRDLAQYFIDANAMKTFFNSRGSLALSVRDIFDTRRFAGENRTASFSQDFYSKMETRIFLLSAKFNF